MEIGFSDRGVRLQACAAVAFAVFLLPAVGAVAATSEGRAPLRVERLATELPCETIERARAAPAEEWRPLDLPPRPSPPLRSGLWLRLSATSGAQGATWTIAMPSNRAQRIAWFEAPDYRGESFDLADPRARQLSFRHLGRELALSAENATYVCLSGAWLGPEELEIEPAAEFRASDLDATQWRSVAFGVILTMSLFSALFFLALRELVFLKYLGYLLWFLLYLICETGAAHRLPLLSRLDVGSVICLDGTAIDVASALGMFFALEFVDLRRAVPRLARAIRWVAITLLPLAVVHLAGCMGGSFVLDRATIAVSNLLVGAGGLTLLVAVSVAAWRKSLYARFFLAGWALIMFGAFAASAQQFFLSRTYAVTLDFMLVAAATESIILSMGLAHRTLTYRRELDRARELADRDALSGLLNRRALDRMTNALDAESSRRGGVAVAMFDLDHFKRINDSAGHLAGDACIRAFAEHLLAETRHTDVAARYGGEEFVVVLPGASSEQAAGFAERVRARAARDGAALDGEPLRFTVSGGVAAGRAEGGIEELIDRADRALYAAKRAGRDRVLGETAGQPPREVSTES